VLIFECLYSERQVKEWLKDYNQPAQYKLTFCAVLYNQLFVVCIKGAPDLSVQQGLIDRSPLLAKDTYAAITLYHRAFNAASFEGINHLITVCITEADPEIDKYLAYAILPIGRLIRKDSYTGAENHQITALVESTDSQGQLMLLLLGWRISHFLLLH
jgi:hypothetical protein